jgi:hypothetical protein
MEGLMVSARGRGVKNPATSSDIAPKLMLDETKKTRHLTVLPFQIVQLPAAGSEAQNIRIGQKELCTWWPIADQVAASCWPFLIRAMSTMAKTIGNVVWTASIPLSQSEWT